MSNEELSSKVEEALSKLESGELSFSKLDSFLGNPNLAALVRRLFLERKYNVRLTSIASTVIDFVGVVGHNIENPIGAAQIPLGVVGPLKVQGDYARGEFYVPMATTEGALVAGVNRGVKAVTMSGGARSKVLYDGMTRAPIIWTPSVVEAQSLASWIKGNIGALREEVKKVTRHGELVDVQTYIVGNILWPRFVFRTGDAMGMNIATIASDLLCSYIDEHYKGEHRCLSVSGNLCSDKKPSSINRLLGRGKYVVSEAIVKGDVLRDLMRTTPESVDFINKSKNLLGNAVAGSPSFNGHVANIIAAIFIATGQDVAQVVESSMAYTWTEVRGNDLYISVTLPSLEVGTVGGGTWLPTQREALELLGVAGGGNPPGVNALKLAEIVAAVALAGELNLLASQVTGELAKAHERLGRGRG
ncbi:hydroxymethylglutaryl-CoA reductase (NADPH) [Acidilobus saccharovorans]|nr:hydroxymethylglutaryl-CoA reductase (NADPH) [Acidilobus saccharovorans]